MHCRSSKHKIAPENGAFSANKNAQKIVHIIINLWSRFNELQLSWRCETISQCCSSHGLKNNPWAQNLSLCPSLVERSAEQESLCHLLGVFFHNNGQWRHFYNPKMLDSRKSSRKISLFCFRGSDFQDCTNASSFDCHAQNRRFPQRCVMQSHAKSPFHVRSAINSYQLCQRCVRHQARFKGQMSLAKSIVSSNKCNPSSGDSLLSRGARWIRSRQDFTKPSKLPLRSSLEFSNRLVEFLTCSVKRKLKTSLIHFSVKVRWNSKLKSSKT